MTNFIPIFPLGVVVYPGESLNLHIFEPRYKQLINECYTAKKPFGIPAVINNRLQDYGTVVWVKEITAVQDNGEMDIKTEGEKVFRILEVVKEIPDKLYSGAIVNYPVNHHHGSAEIMRRVLASMKELFKLLKVEKSFKKPDAELTTYDIAHHVGFSLQEEYEFLNLLHERQRQEYLRLHLVKVMPMLAEMENLKVKVKLNGHFKNLSSFKFE
ncbi:MAG TPA: LON peptidase substrate-binding domain-containing protein [Flavisolibacter sp.]|jgi:Lon protease-like protein|nr:LON peptidase substrate-binding domain-containing protein [Flavisolibacter sp.]